MALTQEQQNIDLALKAVKSDIKLRYPSLADTAAVSGYNGALTILPTANGDVYNYFPSSTAAIVGKFVLPATGKGGTGRWILKASTCNVLDFGADNTAATDSAGAFNSAIAYAKSLQAINGGLFRMFIQVNPGWYLLRSTLNLTNTNGIWLVGLGGSYINTGFIGCTRNADGTGAGIIADFSGSTRSGARNISFTSSSDWGNVSSTKGVQFALTDTGGLNCGIENCFFQLGDNATVNNGAGTIGIANSRSEEFAVKDCYIKANLGMVFTNNPSLAGAGYAHTLTSDFVAISTGAGSMGVVDCCGQMSVINLEKRQPAIVLNNVNSFRYHGYLSRASATIGNVETAVSLNGQSDNIHISGTIESFSRIATGGGKCTNVKFDIVTANQTAPATEAFNLTGAIVSGSRFNVAFTIPAEFNNGRSFLYHAPVNNGDSPATGSISNSEFTCSEWGNNINFISPNLLNASQNCRFYTSQPFEKVNGRIIDLKNYPILLGTVQAGNPEQQNSLIRFTKADRTTTGSNNAGIYIIKITGTVRAGGDNAPNICLVNFEAVIMYAQKNTGVGDSANLQYNQILKIGNTAYSDITQITPNLDLTGAYPAVRLYVKHTGTGFGEPITFTGKVELTSQFTVNQSVIFN